ncbi:hypothetical protein BRARA_I01769 [Brassica rapa]|uniref:Myb-like domain-containing protein n=1 Tax=Brassica campestris TaxID=3711 RepID=A0A397XUN7_BRACM|nr:hypothetical protein BRARA_I01769 [Brassica rapa]
MYFNPFEDSVNFVELLNSQQNVFLGSQGRVSLSSSQQSSLGSQAVELRAERKEKKSWTVTEDILLISALLNTSKDPVVGHEQKSVVFWTRVAAYFSANTKLAASEKREGSQCKQRWHKLNEAVCKFVGAYDAATRESSSITKKKLCLEHAWNELRNQKWCELATAKTENSSKRRKFADGSHSGASSQVNENDAGVEGTSRPPDVKVAKVHGKKPQVDGKDVSDFQLMWNIKKDDLAIKQQLSKMRLLESLVAKEKLAAYEEALKKKLINELM